jgi:uncharacterized protein YkwD
MPRSAPALAACLGLLAFALTAHPALAHSCAGASTYQRTVVCLVNAERLHHGLPRLDVDHRLARAAHGHAADMVARRYFSHTSPSGTTPGMRAQRSGYVRGWRRWTVGEALAFGSGRFAGPRTIVAAWMRSAGHRAVVLYPSVSDIGVGAARGTPHGTAGVTVALEVGRR